MPIVHKPTTIGASPLSTTSFFPLSGSESDRSSDTGSIGSPRDASSPEPEPHAFHDATVVDTELTEYLDHPTGLSGFYRHPVTADQFWSLSESPKFRVALEGRGHTYNSKTQTLEVKNMSIGLHNAGWMWLSTGFDAMCEDGIIGRGELAQKARRARNPVGLIAQAENKAYSGFDDSTPWKDMCRTPDWCLYRISSTLAGDKPFIVMEIGVSQRMTRLPGSKSNRESLQDRAEAWLLATCGITKAVVLIDLSMVKKPSADPAVASSIVVEEDTDADADTPADPDDLFQSPISAIKVIKVTVQMWRLDPGSGKPSISESHEFIVSSDSQYWEDTEIPPEFPAGITFLPSDLCDTPADDAMSFVLPMVWLREYIIGFWALHVEAAKNAKEGKKRRATEGKSPVKRVKA